MHFVFEYSNPGLKVRYLHISRESPLESGKQSLFHPLQVFGWFVGCQDELLSCMVQVVENMEEDILCLGLVGKELNIINDQHFYQLIKMYEVVYTIIFQRIQKLVGKLLGGHVQHRLLRVVILYKITNGLSQVGFS